MLFATLYAALGLGLAAPTAAAHPGALWSIVHGLCVRDQRLLGRPAPCAHVDLAAGIAVVADPEHKTQVLLVPTRRLRGIESPALLADGGPNYWQAAWDARRHFEHRAHRPVARDDVALAVNSIVGRSQDQLHIHVDCVSPAVKAQLEARQDRIGLHWSTFPIPLEGQRYRVRRLAGADLGDNDPFKLLAAGDWRAARDMGRYTIAVIGATFHDGSPGFWLLADSVDPRRGDRGVAEDLIDHDCAVLRPTAGRGH